MEEWKKESYLNALKQRYRRGDKRQKGKLLDELVEQFGLSRRQARRLLRPKAVGRPVKSGKKRGRPSKYQDPGFKQALSKMWKHMNFVCSRHMKAMMPEWLDSVQRHYGSFELSVQKRLLSISSPTIDRILKPYKADKGLCSTRSGGFRDQIPIQESIWDIKIPGYLEADTVAHCGGSLCGEFINSLVMVDINTLWTEPRASFGKGSGPIVTAIEDIEFTLPFAILGYDTDNGTEVLNQHVLNYFQKEREIRGKTPVTVTRSRPYKKNDNAHVEQRNDSIARRWLGYQRLDFIELLPLVNYYYKYIISPMCNHFYSVFKLSDKIRIKSRTRRVYADPLTPYARVMQSEHVCSVAKAALERLHAQLDPIELRNQQIKMRKQIDNALKALKKSDCSHRLLAVPVPHQALLEFHNTMEMLLDRPQRDAA